jgi:hypothetical protein
LRVSCFFQKFVDENELYKKFFIKKLNSESYRKLFQFFYSEKPIKILGPEFHHLNVPLYEVNSLQQKFLPKVVKCTLFEKKKIEIFDQNFRKIFGGS